MRALETGRYLIRSTNNGISAFIDPEGKIVKRSGQFDYEVLDYEVHPRIGSTPFVIYGNWLILIPSLLIILISLSGHEPVKNRKKI
jgi:apolipoprotein N-acyltransferase